MKQSKSKIIDRLQMAVLVLGLTTLGCGDEGPAPIPFAPCATHSDCPTAQICHNNYCIPGTLEDVSEPEEDTSENGEPDTVTPADTGEDIATDIADDTPQVPDTGDPPSDIGEDTETTPDSTVEDVEDVEVEPDTFLEPGTCLEHEDCPSLQLCAPQEICIEPTICLWNEDCHDDRVCDGGKCQNDYAGCTTNADCAGNGICNAVTHTCQSLTPCTNDGDCIDDLFCSTGACIECINSGHCPSFQMACVANFCQEPDECSNDVDCLDGNICQDTLCTSPFYPADVFEENDSPTQAKVLTEGGATPNLTIQQWDEDWYKVSVATGEGIIVRVQFDDENGDLDVILYNDTANLILDLDTASTHIAIVSQPPGGSYQTYLVQVLNPTGNVPTYSIEVFKPPKLFCDNDDLDLTAPNDDASNATILSEPTYDAVGRRICPGDEDWYAVTVGTFGATTITASIEYIHHLGDLDVLIYDEDLTPMSNTSTPASFEYAIAENLPPGTYYVVVSGADEDVANSYELQIQDVSSTNCDFDAYELNDSAFGAPLFEGTNTQLVLCPGDVDWYVTEVPAGKGMKSHLSYSNVSSQLRIEHILADTTTESAVDDGLFFPKGQTAQEVGFEGTNKDTHVYTRISRIEPPNFGSMTPYTLDVEVVDAFCIEDENEENDGAETATPAKTLFGLTNQGKACPGDSDWYSVNIEAGDIVSFNLTHNTENNPLLVTFFEPNGTTTLGLSLLSFNEYGSYGVLNTNSIADFTDGSYFVVITGSSPTPYSLTTHIAPGSSDCLFDDVAEPNNTLFNSKPLPFDVSKSYYFCPNNPDFFHFLAGPNAPVTLNITVPPTNQKVTLTYTSPSLENKKTWILDENGGAVELPTVEEGIHFISLHSPYDTTYELSLDGSL